MEGVEQLMDLLQFYKNKNVLITGHTGFKGTWLCQILLKAGANVSGYSLAPPTEPNLYSICDVQDKINSFFGDVRDFSFLKKVFDQVQPEIVIHLAAQPLVKDSYKNPLLTYETNVMGTVNILECIRLNSSVKSFLNVTTDKVYKNREWVWGYRETEQLDGLDPYSNSKSCSELLTHSYNDSFFYNRDVAISTARAGNVIGGGDFANDRIIPDCVRAVGKGDTIYVRNPNSIRPYQHVLEPLYAYLMILKEQYLDISYSGYYNIGPDDYDCITTGELVALFCKKWGNGQEWVEIKKEEPHEATFLKLDCSKFKAKFSWSPSWKIEKAIEETVEWTKEYLKGNNIVLCMNSQIDEYLHSKIGGV